MILSKKHGIGAEVAVAPANETQFVTAGVDVGDPGINATIETRSFIESVPTEPGVSPEQEESTVLIEVPIRPVDPKSHHTRFLSLRLSKRASTALQMVWAGLRGAHEQLSTGKHVDTKPQALQWMLDKVADAVE